MFHSHTPVTLAEFHDRAAELARIRGIIKRLAEGRRPPWLAIIGQRKTGKSSLLLEAQRRAATSNVAFLVMDLFERTPVTLDIFRTYALRALDALLGPEAGRSLERSASGGNYAAALSKALKGIAVPDDVRDALFSLPTGEMSHERLVMCLELPQQLAVATNRPLLTAWDEFQELLSAGAWKRNFDPVATMRSIWQRHDRVAYVISGSAPSVLRELVSSERSPFFHHFDVLELGPMAADDARSMLVSAAEGAFDDTVANALIGVVGGNPFYLQVLGEELLRDGPPFDDAAIKHVLQRTLFSRTGRLALYFERLHAGLVGRSGQAAAALAALAPHPDGVRLTNVATAIGAPSGDTARYIERLGDAVTHLENGLYAISDPAFALWIRWREPSGSVVPMTVVGSEGERRAAEALARLGFDLVYQSRASHGAFDLLATRGPQQLGLQVKRSELPLSFTPSEWKRMQAEAARFRWRFVIAAVTDEDVWFLDPENARVGRTVRIDSNARIDNLLRWIDNPPLTAG